MTQILISHSLSSHPPIFSSSYTHLLILPQNTYLCLSAGRSAALSDRGGKSGQHRAPCFLTGRRVKARSRVTENDRPGESRDKGEKAG